MEMNWFTYNIEEQRHWENVFPSSFRFQDQFDLNDEEIFAPLNSPVNTNHQHVKTNSQNQMDEILPLTIKNQNQTSVKSQLNSTIQFQQNKSTSSQSSQMQKKKRQKKVPSSEDDEKAALKNIFINFKKILVKAIQRDYKGENQLLIRLNSRKGGKISDFDELFKQTEFEQILDKYFRSKRIYRDILKSDAFLKTKIVYLKYLGVFERSFKKKQFKGIRILNAL